MKLVDAFLMNLIWKILKEQLISFSNLLNCVCLSKLPFFNPKIFTRNIHITKFYFKVFFAVFIFLFFQSYLNICIFSNWLYASKYLMSRNYFYHDNTYSRSYQLCRSQHIHIVYSKKGSLLVTVRSQK